MLKPLVGLPRLGPATFGLVGLYLTLACGRSTAAPNPDISFWRTPDNGIQPQAAVGPGGVVHLVYYKGDPAGGDLFYVHRTARESTFSNPIRVNSQRGSAIAIGTIRGAQLAIGKGGRVHVVWNGGSGAAPVQHRGAPLLYTRLNVEGGAFEPERDMIAGAAGLDGGSSVAADEDGNVYVTWHAPKPGDVSGEETRAVFLRRSSDDGKTFGPEHPALQESTGACGCCGMRALAGNNGSLYMLFRAASALTNRDELLVISRDRGDHARIAQADRWVSATCPMSSAFLSQGPREVLAAWETADQVYYSRVHPDTGRVAPAVAPPGTSARKHPVAVQNQAGQVLLVWTEGTGWQKGGSLAWQLFDSQGRPAGQGGTRAGVPVWGLVTAVVHPDGRFAVIY